MKFFKDLLRPAPHKPEISDQTEVQEKYNFWRMRIFYSIYIGYVFYYLTRKCLAFAMPTLMHELGYDKTQLGILATALTFSYGISKFVSGIIADQSNPRYFMATGLIASGLCSILFGCSSSLPVFILLWSLNGWMQGCGWPSCTRLLAHWYSKSERGRWWSLFATSQNLGGAITPFIAAFCAQQYGWRGAMIVPGVLALLGGLFLINRLRDTPQSLGLPPIERFRFDKAEEPETDQERELTPKEILFNYVLRNPYLWMLGIGYFFIYLIRQGISDWTVLYLIETKGYSQIGAGTILFWFEVGGILGGLVAGWASDRLFSGNRGPINVIFCLLNGIAIWAIKNNTIISPAFDAILLFTAGFLLFGPLILVGIAAVELTHKKAAATASGFIGWISYLGAAASGYPLSLVTQWLGWEGFFTTLTISALITTVLLLPMWSVQTKAPSKRLCAVLANEPHFSAAMELFSSQRINHGEMLWKQNVTNRTATMNKLSLFFSHMVAACRTGKK
jgi:OPA family sugar phosphate sensor protein UhpC-like MFS transporter